ncbi:hypothetical protein KK083_11820 [Fulvivirgaceae bacterium PWU4]|uniref:Uncharacterized protein n=1 Tax=Chryseosolibacter histidini TaxID=2782349 RepID=A0AAP2GN23_9BACT|nr:hypothetical protein [Chryseosolibacter histidini]MBT1697568.1 hypothetical protein [Chryseosolibacter histidini]
MRYHIVFLFIISYSTLQAQVKVDLKDFNRKNGATVTANGEVLSVMWPAGKNKTGKLTVDLSARQPIFKSIGLQEARVDHPIASGLDPAFVLTVGKRDLISQNGWNIFFDKVPNKPFRSYNIDLEKQSAAISSVGTRTVISIGSLKAPGFTGTLQITLYNGSPLMNIAAVMSTDIDSTAILYDAGLVSKNAAWQQIGWSDVNKQMRSANPNTADSATNLQVKYRSIVGENSNGSLALFPAPHQYFYPLDEAFNLKFVWAGNQYRNMVNGYGIGIRQDLYGDRRFVPWFNAPPTTRQRLNFFVWLSSGNAATALDEVKKFTNNDRYTALPGYKTMTSHFHNEFIMKVVMANKPVPETPAFINVFKRTGVDIVHLGEFHYTAHPKGPDSLRLKELHALFQQCERLSSKDILLLPGEEPNEFFGGHWLQLFPKPVYWIMSRKEGAPFVTEDPRYGKVYRISNEGEMLDLLKREHGLAWTAHPRTKGSTGYPDKYKSAAFFKDEHFLGAAWKAMPADLSVPFLGKRVLDLMDDMNNWGDRKKVLAEADLFTIEPENEMYAHLNVNYLKMDRLPEYKNGWQPVVDALRQGKFFSSTGEVLIPEFTVDGRSTGEELSIGGKKSTVTFSLRWTFPMNYAEIISGDGQQVYRERINLNDTQAFGEQTFRRSVDLTGRKWVRLEAWDVAANGAFTQTVWIK